MPKNKKHPAQLQKRPWKNETMQKAMELIASGKFTVYGAAKKLHLPYSTVKTRYEGRSIRPDLGRKTVFTYEQESSMRRFLDECISLGIPKTLKDFELDVQLFIEIYEIDNPFKNGIIGRYWLNRFLNLDNIPFVFVTKEEQTNILSKLVSIKEWTTTRRKYIRSYNYGKLLDDPRRLFIIEVDDFNLQTIPTNRITTLITSNGLGELLTPLVMHHGQINHDTEYYHSGYLHFIENHDGKLDRRSLITEMERIAEYCELSNIQKPVVVNLTPNAANVFSFPCWLLCYNIGIIAVMMPSNVHTTLRTRELGIFDTLLLQFDAVLQERYTQMARECTVNDFLDVLNDIFVPGVLRPLITNTFQKMSMNDLQRKSRPTQTYEINPANERENQEIEVDQLEIVDEPPQVHSEEADDVILEELQQPPVTPTKVRERRRKTVEAVTQTTESSFQFRTTYSVTMNNPYLPDLSM